MHSVVIVLGSVEQTVVEKIMANLPAPSGLALIKRIANSRGPSDQHLTAPTAREHAVARDVAEEFVTNLGDIEVIVYEAGLGGDAALSQRPRFVREAVYDRQRHFGVPLAPVFAVGPNGYIQRRW